MTSAQKSQRLSKLDRIKLKIKNALKEIEKEEKVSIRFGSTRYDLVTFTSPMTITETAKTTVVRENTLDKNRDLSLQYGFAGNIVGMEYNGGIITGFKPRNTKYPIIFEKMGKSYKTSLGSIKLKLKKEDIIAHDKKEVRNIKIDKIIED